jgi:hypothetical protein
VDFSYPTNPEGDYIYSQRSNVRVLGTALTGVFDDISLGLAAVAALAMTALVWIMMRNSVVRWFPFDH